MQRIFATQRVWVLSTCVIAAVVVLPIAAIFVVAISVDTATITHIVSTRLLSTVGYSVLLLCGASVGATCIGVLSAWLVRNFIFPGRRLFIWAMLLPLAMPPYIVTYVYSDIIPYRESTVFFIKLLLPYADTALFPLAHHAVSLVFASVMFAISLYPYVFAVTYAALAQQSMRIGEVGMMFGFSAWQRFYRITLPIARPAVVVGVMLVCMETLADYGTVAFLGIPTFTVGIFRMWFGFGDVSAAAFLSLALFGCVAVLLLIEQRSRAKARFYQLTGSMGGSDGLRLCGWRAWMVTLLCAMPIVCGFVIPIIVLIQWSFFAQAVAVRDMGVLLGNTLLVAGAAAFLCVVLALVLGYARRLINGKWLSALLHIATIGYAVPGLVIAIGVLYVFGKLDAYINTIAFSLFAVPVGLLLSGSFFALLYAYTVRFLTASYHGIDAALRKIRPTFDDNALLLGMGRRAILQRIHFPMMKPAVYAAFLLVFVDVVKELPVTLAVRPFNFTTLSVRTWELASDERLYDAAPAALMLVLVGAAAIVIVQTIAARSVRNNKEHHV